MYNENLLHVLDAFDTQFEGLYYIFKEMMDCINEEFGGDYEDVLNLISHSKDYSYLTNVIIAFMTQFKNEHLETKKWGVEF